MAKVQVISLPTSVVANSLDPDWAQQNAWPDLDPNCLTFWCYDWKVDWKKSADDKKIMKNYPVGKEITKVNKLIMKKS